MTFSKQMITNQLNRAPLQAAGWSMDPAGERLQPLPTLDTLSLIYFFHFPHKCTSACCLGDNNAFP